MQIDPLVVGLTSWRLLAITCVKRKTVCMHKEELLNTSEVCEALGVKPYTVSRWVAKGALKFVKRGSGKRGHMLFLREDVDALAKTRAEQAA